MDITVPVSNIIGKIVKTEDKPKITLSMEVDASAFKLADIMNLKSPLSVTFASSQTELALDGPDSLPEKGKQ